MGQALYRTYRSASLAEIVGQEHITDTLAAALKSGRISHAYLFTGPRGVGKTSIARILAHEINGLPYDELQSHIDIIEIDAASNNGVEDVRDLREKVFVAPAQAKYKVYIIDEVHMLSKAAFNALLKTLEEPPAHVVFILATTEVHKLPETIISRTQRYVFRPIDAVKAHAHLRSIADKEKIDITDEALDLVVQHGGGSFRDSISLLDQLSGSGQAIDLATVQSVLGIAPATAIDKLRAAIASQQPAATLYAQLADLLQQGYQAANIAKQLATAIRHDILEGKLHAGAVAPLLSALVEVPVSHDPAAQLEVIILREAAVPVPATASPAATTTPVVAPTPVAVKHTAAAPEPATAPVEQPPKNNPEPSTPTPPVVTASAKPAKAASAPKVEHIVEPDVPQTEASPTAAASSALSSANWQQVLDILKKQYNTLYGIVRMAEPDFSKPGALDLAFGFAFHQKRAKEAKNLQAISDAVQHVAGVRLEITCSHRKDAVAPPPQPAGAGLPPVPQTAPPSGPDPLASISNIFGGGELIQSE